MGCQPSAGKRQGDTRAQAPGARPELPRRRWRERETGKRRADTRAQAAGARSERPRGRRRERETGKRWADTRAQAAGARSRLRHSFSCQPHWEPAGPPGIPRTMVSQLVRIDMARPYEAATSPNDKSRLRLRLLMQQLHHYIFFSEWT